jgi:hypothetical protein
MTIFSFGKEFQKISGIIDQHCDAVEKKICMQLVFEVSKNNNPLKKHSKYAKYYRC